MIQSFAGVVKLVDTIDSKSIERKLVSVQVRSPVLKAPALPSGGLSLSFAKPLDSARAPRYYLFRIFSK